MGTYTGPKGKINRRLGVAIYETNGSVKALERRPNPPGMHPKPRKVSDYGLALLEKQKVKHYYGLGERTLRRLFAEAQRKPGNTGETLLMLCERRLDNVIRRAGLTKTRSQARQGITHGHFLLNGHKVTVPSVLVRAGDVIDVKNRESLMALYMSLKDVSQSEAAAWLDVNPTNLRVRVQSLPQAADCTAPVNISPVVVLLTR